MSRVPASVALVWLLSGCGTDSSFNKSQPTLAAEPSLGDAGTVAVGSPGASQDGGGCHAKKVLPVR